MKEPLTARAHVTIDVATDRVWEALVDPQCVKQWLFGTNMEVSAWEVGGQIRYRGSWQGKTYEDKGEIVELEPGRKLVSTYWSSMSGAPDAPENYQRVTYELMPAGHATVLTITQTGSATEEAAKHAEANWTVVLSNIRKLLES